MDNDPKDSSINWGAEPNQPVPLARPPRDDTQGPAVEKAVSPAPATESVVRGLRPGSEQEPRLHVHEASEVAALPPEPAVEAPETALIHRPRYVRMTPGAAPQGAEGAIENAEADPDAEDVEDTEDAGIGFDRPPATRPFEGFYETDFDDKSDEPFDRPGVDKIGIIGGKGVGKSYLFQAMVYRTLAGPQSGALTYYLENDAIHLFIAGGEEGSQNITHTGLARGLNRTHFVDKYRDWQRLAATTFAVQQWYRLRLPYRTGWLGGGRSALDVEFFDGSGEGFQSEVLNQKDRALWRKAYLPARVMVFCLPLWAAFPNASLTDDDWSYREYLLKFFEQVVLNYRGMRERNTIRGSVKSILALTMSDDPRSALSTLFDRWIAPYLESPHTHLRQLRTGRGVARYLANARSVSEALHEEFVSARDPRVAGIPQTLDFGRGRPWIVPVSAMDGARLDDLEGRFRDPDDPARATEARKVAPTPVHVELPLLLALCERENALM